MQGVNLQVTALDATALPEPGSLALALALGGALAWRLGRRLKSAPAPG